MILFGMGLGAMPAGRVYAQQPEPVTPAAPPVALAAGPAPSVAPSAPAAGSVAPPAPAAAPSVPAAAPPPAAGTGTGSAPAGSSSGASACPRCGWHNLPVVPSVVLSANQDGSDTVKANLTFEWHRVSDRLLFVPGNVDDWAPVYGFSVAPTFSASDNTKKPLFSIGTPGGAAPSFGSTSFSLGVMGAYTRYAPVSPEERKRLDSVVTDDDIDYCTKYCANGANPGDCNAFLSVIQSVPSPVRYNIDRDSLCKPRVAVAAERFNAIVEKEIQRYRYPGEEVSLWGGGGASQFAYYQAQSPAVATALPTYASADQWRGNGSAAFKFNAVPFTDPIIGVTFEALAVFTATYQASSASGMGCTGNLGTVTSDMFANSNPSYLSQCGATQPIGPPAFGTDLVAEAYVGWVDVVRNYGRVAIGGGVDRNFGKSLTTWSIKIPAYVNGTAPVKEAAAARPKTPPDNGVMFFSYDGIVRFTPTIMYTADPTGKKTGWGFSVGVDLIANHNLFLRADSLVK